MPTRHYQPAHSPDSHEANAYYSIHGYPQISRAECAAARKIVPYLEDFPNAQLIVNNKRFLSNLLSWCRLIDGIGLPTVRLDQSIGNCNLEVSQIKPITDLFNKGLLKTLKKIKTDRRRWEPQGTNRARVEALLESELSNFKSLFDRKQLVGRMYGSLPDAQGALPSTFGLICIGKGDFDTDSNIRNFAPSIRFRLYPNIEFSSCTLDELKQEMEVLRISFRPPELRDTGSRFIALACLLYPKPLSFPGAEPKDLNDRLESLRLRLLEKAKYDKFLRLILTWGLLQSVT